ncbi:GDSL-type esterase/lipase family protein [Sphingomonas sp.]|uniref:GDSL-type esterase/lipase family protein n=1 Tax=Sphingomonas sp. TaxID=28214 RepID=UPI0025FF9F53|nr:GDSL-type esterase/lipase family protein [Sphingomonas sp.]
MATGYLKLGMLALMGASSALAAAPTTTVPAWIASTTFAPAKPRAGELLRYDNQSVRQDVRGQTATTRIRLRLTNEYGTAPVTLDRIEIRRIAADGALGPASPATFGGEPGTTIEPGAVAYTDMLAFPAPAFSDIAIIVHYPGETEPVAHRFLVRVADGTTTPTSATKPARGAAIVSAIETEAPPQQCRRVIVTLGDSITEGAGSTPGNDWPSRLGRALAGQSCPSIVANAGISGNRVLTSGGSPSMIARFDHDVLAVPGVTDLIVLGGINDVRAVEEKADDPAAGAALMIAGYRQIVARAHAHGIRVIGGTVLPYKGTARQGAYGLAAVDQINAAIRSGGVFDAVIDFNRAVADPADPQRMRETMQKGDWLHPNDAGYEAMTTAIPPALFSGEAR